MLIKYLRSLLSLFVAKNETAFVVRQMLPSYTSIRHDSVDSFIAPSDGWCYATINQREGTSGYLKITGQSNFMDQKTYDNQIQGGFKTALIPVRKGINIKLETNFTNPSTRIFAFIPAEGS